MSGFEDNPFGEPVVDNPFAVSDVLHFQLNGAYFKVFHWPIGLYLLYYNLF